ncbi:MAG: hypothetical protein GTO62_11190, partial [Planctomycetales bacterium]|nr:hypothetical protein [Planctomycetales bacterium]NIP69831.1 hypothetical protein [Planctomycetales bacterium]
PPGSYGIGSQYGYRQPRDREKASACTAIGLLCRMYLGTRKEDPGLQLGVASIAERGPLRNNMYYNYYASMLLYQADGPDGQRWKEWNVRMREFLIQTQVKRGKDQGSWYFHGGHGPRAGGRVYCTAMAAMTLEVYYRYMPLYQRGNVEKDDFPLE